MSLRRPLPGAPTVGVWTHGLRTNKYKICVSTQIWMVMQVRHRGFILVQAKNALRPVWLWILYNLAPKGACSRGYKLAAREG